MYQYTGVHGRAATPSDLEIKRCFAESIQKKMDQDNVSISALAQRMKTGRTSVRRILDATNTSVTFRSMTRAAEAVGLQIRLTAIPMSAEKLGHLAHRLAESDDKAEARKLTDEIVSGFYGGG